MQVHWRAIMRTRRLGTIVRIGADTAPPLGGDASSPTPLHCAVEHAPIDVLHDAALIRGERAPRSSNSFLLSSATTPARRTLVRGLKHTHTHAADQSAPSQRCSQPRKVGVCAAEARHRHRSVRS